MATYKEIHGVKVQYRDSDATAIEGDVWYNRSTGKLKMYSAVGSWASGGTMAIASTNRYGFGTQSAAGMAAGTGSYFLAIAGSLVIALIAYALNITNYGSIHKSEFILQFRIKNDDSDSHQYVNTISRYAKKSTLLHVEPSGDNNTSKMSFDIVMKKDEDHNKFASEIAAFTGISEVGLVAARHDVDY